MSKDVKSATPRTSIVLPKGMSRPAAASVSRSEDPEYFVVDRPKTQASKLGDGPSTKTSEGQHVHGVVRQADALGPQSLGTPSPHPLLAKMALSAAPAAEAELRRQILLARSRGGETSLAKWKHYYTTSGTATGNTVTTTEATYNLAQIVGGTSVNTRVTNTIKLHKLRLKIRLDIVPSAVSAVLFPVTTHIILWRDKVPAVPGTAPTLYASDSNPPSSATAMFSRLGVSSSGYSNDLAVLNPSTQYQYHIYKKWHIINNHPALGGNLSGTYATGLKSEYINEEFNLHGVEQIYQAFGDTDSDLNNIYLTFVISNTANGCTITEAHTTDLEFEDVQI